jgi:hypothetical protein
VACTGDFGSEEPLDTTIEGMRDEAMRFPLTYGYSLVGAVVEVTAPLEPFSAEPSRLS